MSTRYSFVNGQYVEDPEGKYIQRRLPGGAVGYQDLSVETPLGYAVVPGTGGKKWNELYPTTSSQKPSSQMASSQQASSQGTPSPANITNIPINPWFSPWQGYLPYLLGEAGYQPNALQSSNKSIPVLLLNQLLGGTGLSLGAPINFGGAGGGLPAYFGNNYGMGYGAYMQPINQAELSPFLKGLEAFGGLGGSLAQRLDSIYNPLRSISLPNLYADYLEMMAPRFQSGWNLYGASPALEGVLNVPNQNPYLGQPLYSTYGGSGYISPFTSSFVPGIPNVWRQGFYKFE